MPLNSFQACFCAFVIIMGSLVEALIIGQMVVIVENFNRRFTEFQQVNDIANTAMRNMKLPEDLQQNVNDYIGATWMNQDKQSEFKKFQNFLCPSLLQEVFS